MKKIFLLLFSFSISFVTAQHSDKLILDSIVESYNNDSVEYAKNGFKEFISSNPGSPYKIIAVYHLALIADKSGNQEEALTLYNQVLSINAPDSIDINLKNSSAKNLSEIYFKNNDYSNALKYLDKAKNTYRFRHFCGNAFAEDDLYMANHYADCYIAQGKFTRAIDILSPYMFNNGLADNSELVHKLYDTYQKIYSKEEIKNEFLAAEKTLEFKKVKYQEEIRYRTLIDIFGRQVSIPSTETDDPADSTFTEFTRRQKAIELIKRSEIYQLATG